MSVVMICRAKAGGCVTTTAVAIGACWPDPRPVTVVEADVSGGSLAARARLQPSRGVMQWVAAAESGRPASVLLAECRLPLPGLGIGVVCAPPDQLRSPATTAIKAEAAVEAVSSTRAAIRALTGQPRLLQVGAEAVLLVDVGHLEPESSAWPLASQVDAVVVCVAPRLDGLAAGLRLAGQLTRRCHSVRLVTVGDGDYRDSEIQQACPVPMLGHVPDDPRSAQALWQSGIGARSRIGRAVRPIAARCARLLPASPIAAQQHEPVPLRHRESGAAEPARSDDPPPPAAPAYLAMYDSTPAMNMGDWS
ncbi:hypothetical protein [Actinocatenispora comari]|uniref:hypothetical protein n=1 Tax=Actinocatenispora comari TaxID=2807577 RepID=UPI001A91662E|nr:hypothetical protein [Actinocatenispora comari]